VNQAFLIVLVRYSYRASREGIKIQEPLNFDKALGKKIIEILQKLDKNTAQELLKTLDSLNRRHNFGLFGQETPRRFKEAIKS